MRTARQSTPADRIAHVRVPVSRRGSTRAKTAPGACAAGGPRSTRIEVHHTRGVPPQRSGSPHAHLGTTRDQFVNILCKTQGKAVHAGAGVQSPNAVPTCREARDTVYTASCASFSCPPQDVVVLMAPRAALGPLAPSLSGAILNTRSGSSGSLDWVGHPPTAGHGPREFRCRLFRRRSRCAGSQAAGSEEPRRLRRRVGEGSNERRGAAVASPGPASPPGLSV